MTITPEILYQRWRVAVRERDWVAAYALARAIDTASPDPELFRKMREARARLPAAISAAPPIHALPKGDSLPKRKHRRHCVDFPPIAEVEADA